MDERQARTIGVPCCDCRLMTPVTVYPGESVRVAWCEVCRNKKGRNIMKIIIGAEIEFGGEKFTVLDVKRHDSTDAKILYLTACDSVTADREQQNKIKMGQAGDNLVDFVKNIMEKGKRGDFGGGFNIGGV